MSIDLDALLVETAQKITTTTNEYNDVQYGSSADTPCLYRSISSLSETGNHEQVRIDGQLWFGASESVVRGDIYYHPNEGYLKVIDITVARTRLTDNSIQFIKTMVQKQRQIS
jgi:hypothetical protein